MSDLTDTPPEWVPDDLKPLFEELIKALPVFVDRHEFAELWSKKVYKYGFHRIVDAPVGTTE